MSLTHEDFLYWIEHTNDLNKFKKNHLIRSEIIQLTPFLPEKCPLRQRLWHLIHNTTDTVLCKMCPKPVRWNPSYQSYTTYCSDVCASKDTEKIARSQAWKQDIDKLRKASELGLINRQKTNLERYGRTNYLASNKGKQTVIPGKIKKYGENFREHELKLREETMLKRYGYKSYLSTEKFKIQYTESSLRKYGTYHPRHSDMVKQKAWATNIERYGTKYPAQSETVREKGKQTSIERYGVTNFNQLHLIEHLDKINNPEWLIEQHLVYKKSFSQLSSELGHIDLQHLIHRCKQYDPTFKTQRYPTSIPEKEICAFLDEHNVQYITNTRDIIPPQEIDIYIPSHKLAIEHCGLHWHSEQRGKDRNYHKNKYLKCKDQNIQLLTIYEDEWRDRKIQVQNKILHLLKLNKNKIYARKCNIIKVLQKDKHNFFENNHIQGDGPGSITYGLTYENQLVAVMSFIKQANNIFVLNRYATSIRVVGGFSKLLKHFQLQHTWKQIVSFADLRWSDGSMYENNGFILDQILRPDYYYSPDGEHRFHKFNYRHKNLPRILEYYDPKLSETENCDNNGILRIWDCGKLRYVVNNTHK